jgi:hypothetical protein
VTVAAGDWVGWARDLAGAYEDIAMIARFEPPGSGDVHVCLVMKDGGQASWFAAGKGVEGLAWTTVPGRAALPRLLADERLRRPGLRLYLSFCDVRALLFAYDGGTERIAGEELVDAPYRMLYPDVGHRPALEEFCLQWGDPVPD